MFTLCSQALYGFLFDWLSNCAGFYLFLQSIVLHLNITHDELPRKHGQVKLYVTLRYDCSKMHQDDSLKDILSE